MNYFCFLILGILSYPFLLLFHITFLLCFSFPLTDLFEPDCFLVDLRQYLYSDFFSCKGCLFLTVIKISNC